MLFPLLFIFSLVGIILLIGWRAWQLRTKYISFHHADVFRAEKERLVRSAAHVRIALERFVQISGELALWMIRAGKWALGTVEQKLLTAQPMEEVFGKRSLKNSGDSSLFLQGIHRHKKEIQKGVIHD